ncbi:MAG: DUF975 family protein [Oscillospiraceae bacterium]|nr:DUF975 family protein [Oscillospiraceae bacterium]
MDKQSAAASLRTAVYPPRRLLAIHAGVTAGLALVLSIISFILNYAITPAGGLGSLDLQAALSTAQVTLRLMQMVLTPFWAAGLCAAALSLARGLRTTPADLTAGFRRFKPLLTSGLTIGIHYLGRGIISMYLSSTLLGFTPLAQTLYDASDVLEKNPEMPLDELLGDAFVPIMVTFFAIFAVVFLAVSLPVFYRYRMTGYLILDEQEKSGVRATLRSRIMMQRRRWDLAKLDLSFWWYYLLLGLGMTLCYGDLILSAAGIALPIPDTVAYWLFLCLGLLMQLGVKILAGPKVAVTYAHRYERYRSSDPPARKPKQVDPKDLPWTY